MPTTPGAAVTPPSPSATEWTDYVRAFGPYSAPDNKLYISFLFRPGPSYGSSGGLQIGTYPRQVQFGAIPGYYLYGLRIGHSGLVLSNIPAVPGQTAFLVLEVQAFPNPVHTSYRLFVDPVARAPQPQYASAEGAIQQVAALPTALEPHNDGALDFDDIDAFILALSDPAAYPAYYPGCNASLADCNGDGSVTFGDINPFVELLSGG